MITKEFFKKNKDLIDGLKCGKEIKWFLEETKNLSKKISLFYHQTKTLDVESEEKLFAALDLFFEKAEVLEKKIKNPQVIKGLKSFFREETKCFSKQSFFLHHSLLKPKGYPGDYQIIEAMYDNVPISTKFGGVLDKYFLRNDYVQAVRDRKDEMKRLLKDFIENSETKSIKILNLACGSCREIRELFINDLMTTKKVILKLVDQEKDALIFARDKLSLIPNNWKINFIQENILNFNNDGCYMKKVLGSQNLIYSIGLADYLPNSVLGPLIRRSFNLLDNNGIIIIAHKNTRFFTSPISDWGADWSFIQRNEKELCKIINMYLPKKRFIARVHFYKMKRIFFVEIQRLN
jgi:extracellular factor (EF) 3-hydroxypalmitic acid methyl ester biosynthesis protein